MKKLWLLITMLLLTACGSGGSGIQATSNSGGTGVLSVQLVDQSAGAVSARAGTTASALYTAPPPGWVRVVVTNPNLNGQPYQQIVDQAFGTGAVQLTIPIGTGFTCEVVTYAKDGALNRMSQYGQSSYTDANSNVSSTFPIIINGNTTIVVSLYDISAAVSPIAPAGGLYSTDPDNSGANKYSVGATIPTPGPFQPAWSLAVKTSSFITPVHLASTPAITFTNLTAPFSYQQQTLYLEGEFFIKTSLIASTDRATNWVFTVDGATLINNVYSGQTSLTAPADTSPPQITYFNPPYSSALTLISPIRANGTDNVAVKYLMVNESSTPPLSTDARWVGPIFRNYTTIRSYTTPTSVIHGVNNTVHLYAWARDPSDNISAVVSGTTTKDVVINDTPRVTALTVTTPDFSPTDIPVSISAENFTGSNDTLQYALTESATIQPITWSAAGVPPTTYSFNFTQTPGVSYTKYLYAWVTDGYSVSSPVGTTIKISDLPLITAFAAKQSALGSNTVNITSLSALASPGNTVAYYLITETSSTPTASASWVAAQPATYVYQGALPAAGTRDYRYLYGWVKDSRGFVSQYKTVGILFSM